MTPFQVCPLRGRNEHFPNEENRQPARLRVPILPKTPGASKSQATWQ
jgi:hypothetical protein